MTNKIDVCSQCGTPRMEGARTLVLYFETDEDRAEFIEDFKEAVPDARASFLDPEQFDEDDPLLDEDDPARVVVLRAGDS